MNCPDCGKPVDEGQVLILEKDHADLQVRLFDRDDRGNGGYLLLPFAGGAAPFARKVVFDGSHNSHICVALRDQEPIRPTMPWVELSEDELVDEIRDRMDWSNAPDLDALGYYS